MSHRARARLVAQVAAATIVAVTGCAAVVDLERVSYRETDADAGVDAGVPIDAMVVSDATIDRDADAGWLDTGDPTCGVRSDGKLHCTNRKDAPLRSEPRSSAPIVNTLRTTSSYFSCWGVGELHAGGNTTWYYTIGDDNPSYGWVAGVMLNTPDAFDANPSAYGLPKCP